MSVDRDHVLTIFNMRQEHYSVLVALEELPTNLLLALNRLELLSSSIRDS